MKTISTGGKTIGVLELLIGIGSIAVYVITSEDVRMEYFLEDPSTTFPVLCLISGIFKVLGTIVIWLKQKFGVVLYAIGSLAMVYLIFILSSDLSFAYSDEMLPLAILYGTIALQFWFIYIMIKAIKLKQE